MNKLKITIYSFLVLVILTVSFPLVLSSKVDRQFSEHRYNIRNIDDIPSKEVAVVLGAGINYNGKPSQILEDRVNTAVDLYKAGKVKKIIMSGDNRFVDYNEPDAMINLAVELGVPKDDLQPDYAGRRTYDTCKRAKEIFGLDEVLLVTQEFHINRALYLCNSFGINSIGVSTYYATNAENYYKLRDIISLSLAYFDVNYRHPEVVLGERIELFKAEK